jgi:hypothetical protein
MDGVTDVRGELERAVPPQEAALRRLIDGERHALDQSLDRLGERIQDTLDWRQQVARHRGALAAGAAGVVLLGVWRRRRRRAPANRAAAAVVAGAREVTTQACEALSMLGSLVSVRRRLPNLVVAPLAAAATRAAMKWWDGGRTVHARPRPAEDHAHEEERWRLEKRMS